MKMHAYGQNPAGAWVPLRVGDDGSQSQPIDPAWSYAAAAGGITDTADVTLVAGTTNKVNYLTSLQLANKSATATEVVIKDGSTIIWRGYAPATGDMRTATFSNPLRSTAGSPLKAACITTATNTLLNAQGFVSASTDAIAAIITDAIEEIFDDLGVLVLDDNSNSLYL
jgi:hypothetical protein